MAAAMTPLAEYGRGFGRANAWLLLAWDDVKNRYRRTTLGPLWLTLSHAISICGIAFAFSTLFGRPLKDFFLYLSAGLTVWGFIAGSLNEGSTIYLRSQNLLFSYDLPASVHIFRFVTGQVITFAHQMLVYLVVVSLDPSVVSWNMLWFFPGLLLLTAAAVGWSTLLSFLGARYRDLGPAISSTTHLAFLLTPIFWERTRVPDDVLWFVLMNPFYHLVEIVRAPLLGRAPDLTNWVVSGLVASLLIGAGVALYSNKRSRLTYWL